MRATRAVATSGLFIAFVCGVGWPAGAQVPPPEVSPEVLSAGAQVPQPEVSPFALSDVPPTPKGEDPFPFFDNYSWRSFIALNWPAMTGAANRGRPDRTKSFGDPGPRVWTTWKSRYEIFQPGGAEPSPWASYAGQNPWCVGVNFANDVVTLSRFSAFHYFNQADFDLHELGGPLVAQNRTYARYEVRVNQPEFNSIVSNKWYIASNLPTPTTTVPFNPGSTEIKAAWRILTDKDTPAIRSRYYVVPNAQAADVASGKCKPQDIALVGLHIVTKTPDRPQWIWSTFEQVDNVPGKTTEPKPPPGVPFSFNNGGPPKALDPKDMPPAISPPPPPNPDPEPMQVVREQKTLPQTMAMNEEYWKLPQIKGTVWQNYMFVMTQWPTKVVPESPSNNGVPQPPTNSPSGSPLYNTALANTTMETYFQSDDGGESCMVCHNISNKMGRDFVMFVTMDAFRPKVPAPGDLFAAKIIGDQALQTANSLSADPMVKSLIEFFNAAKGK